MPRRSPDKPPPLPRWTGAPKNVVDVLRRVRKLLEHPARWTRNVHARNEAGLECLPRSSTAYCWCLEGACRYIGGRYAGVAAGHLEETAQREFELGAGDALATFNDRPTTRHTTVLRLIDVAIEVPPCA